MSRDYGLNQPGTRIAQQVALPDWCILAALTATWVMLALLVDPRGNFAILDDWSYGRAVKDLIQHGELRYDGWNAATLLLQVLYGAAFCWPFGFSFETLRISTLVAGLAGGIGTYLLLREAVATRGLAALGSMVMMLNPSYFQHSFTFMTDVPFAALVVFSSLYFLRALRTGSIRSVLLGTVLACCATLVRQPGMMIPVAFGVATLATSKFDARLFVRAILPASAAIVTYIAYAAVIKHLRMEPVLLGTFQANLMDQFQDRGILPAMLFLVNRARILLVDISLMVLPLLVMLFGYSASRPRAPRQVLAVLAVVLAGVAVLCRGLGAPDLPYKVFSPMPLVMVGQAEWGPSDEHHRLRPALQWAQLAAVSLLVFVLAARAMPEATKPQGDAVRFDRAGAVFGFSASALLIAPFLLSHLYERYLIPLVPMFIVALTCLVRRPAIPEGRGWQNAATAFAFLAVIGFGVISILFVHDGLLWNRLRWEAVNALVYQKQVDPETIDAGLSVSGWYLFPADGPLRKRYANSPSEKGQWWRNDSAKYIVAIMTPKRLERMIAVAKQTPDDELEVIWNRSFTGWLPGSGGKLLVCQGRLCESVFTKK